MKKRFCFVAILAISCLSCAMYCVQADTFAEKILRSFPQADRNNDGVLSAEEEAFVIQRVMQRYPQADQDGDGVLSETEKLDLIQKASQRGKKQRPSSTSRRNQYQNAEAVLNSLASKVNWILNTEKTRSNRGTALISFTQKPRCTNEHHFSSTFTVAVTQAVQKTPSTTRVL